MSQEVANIIHNSFEVVKAMPQVLQVNTAKADKAAEVGLRIEMAIKENGGVITPELDERMKKYIINSNAAIKEMKEGRAPGTQMMNEISKMFTAQEARIDPGKAGTFANTFQGHRNNYATQLANEQRERERIAREKAEKDTEAIKLRADVYTALNNHFQSHLQQKKQNMLSAFNGATLQTIDGVEAKLKGYTPAYALDHFNQFNSNIKGRYHSEVEVIEMVDNVAAFADFENTFESEMRTQCQDLIAKLPSKRTELQEAEDRRIAKEAADKEAAAAKTEADKKAAEERAALLKQQEEEAAASQKKREEEEAERLRLEGIRQQEEAQQKIEANSSAETMHTLFQAEQEISAAPDAPESRTGFEIEVLSPSAYVLMMEVWFKNEGAKLSLDKIEKTTMKQIKTFCEKLAHKTGEKIESKYLEYKSVSKAVNRKEKA